MIEASSKQCARCRADKVGVQAPKDAPIKPTSELVSDDRQRQKSGQELSLLRRKYDESLRTIKALESDLSAMNVVSRGVETFAIEPKLSSGTSEGTPVWVASDWHSEELVDPRTVNGLNRFDLEIAKARATQFFQGGLRLTRLLEQDIKIPQVVIPLLGDFITNDIHEENVETAQLPPMEAISFARNLIISGIDFVLNHSTWDLLFQCHSGNHARTTRKNRAATEKGHSLEYLMYLHLADYYRSEGRVKFSIADGYHSYLDIYDKKLRFHHGHSIRYQGGIGGLTIPANKAIASWNNARRVDLDVFGHFHTAFDGGNFISNGSLIGYNGFALSIKAPYEPPRQQLFLLDKRRGKTCVWPILFDELGSKQ